MKMNKIGIIATMAIMAALLISTISMAATTPEAQVTTTAMTKTTTQTQERTMTPGTNEEPVKEQTREQIKEQTKNEDGTRATTMKMNGEAKGNMSGEGNQTRTKAQIKEQIEEKIENEKRMKNQTKKYTPDMKEVKKGEFKIGNGAKVAVKTEANNEVMIQGAKSKAKVKVTLVNDGEKLRVKLSNGEAAEVNVMPDKATEEVTKRLRIKNCSENCSVELTEVKVGDQVRAAYKVEAKKEAKFLGLFKVDMGVEADVDATTGEVIEVKKPWWSFLASEE